MVEAGLTSAPGSKGIGASDGREEGGRKPPVLEYTGGSSMRYDMRYDEGIYL